MPTLEVLEAGGRSWPWAFTWYRSAGQHPSRAALLRTVRWSILGLCRLEIGGWCRGRGNGQWAMANPNCFNGHWAMANGQRIQWTISNALLLVRRTLPGNKRLASDWLLRGGRTSPQHRRKAALRARHGCAELEAVRSSFHGAFRVAFARGAIQLLVAGVAV